MAMKEKIREVPPKTIDEQLRAAGYRIHERHGRDEPLWESREGKIIRQSIAIRKLTNEQE